MNFNCFQVTKVAPRPMKVPLSEGASFASLMYGIKLTLVLNSIGEDV
jgi:hypothetical protein